uniref:Uncharacterized protein n=1 Tax=Cacopsylla melanoneura TaxID=428564 RepID=A0A8D8QBI8_9HEMI
MPAEDWKTMREDAPCWSLNSIKLRWNWNQSEFNWKRKPKPDWTWRDNWLKPMETLCPGRANMRPKPTPTLKKLKNLDASTPNVCKSKRNTLRLWSSRSTTWRNRSPACNLRWKFSSSIWRRPTTPPGNCRNVSSIWNASTLNSSPVWTKPCKYTSNANEICATALLRYRDSAMNWRRHENRRMPWLERTRNLPMTFTMPATPLLNSPVVSTNWKLNCADSRTKEKNSAPPTRKLKPDAKLRNNVPRDWPPSMPNSDMRLRRDCTRRTKKLNISANKPPSRLSNSPTVWLKLRPSLRPKLPESRRSCTCKSPNWKCLWMSLTRPTSSCRRPSRNSLSNSLTCKTTTTRPNVNWPLLWTNVLLLLARFNP